MSSEVSDFRIIPVEHWILLRERRKGIGRVGQVCDVYKKPVAAACSYMSVNHWIS